MTTTTTTPTALSIPQRIRHVLYEHSRLPDGETEVTFPQLILAVQSFSDQPVNSGSVKAAISTMVGRGEVVRIRPGVFCHRPGAWAAQSKAAPIKHNPVPDKPPATLLSGLSTFHSPLRRKPVRTDKLPTLGTCIQDAVSDGSKTIPQIHRFVNLAMGKEVGIDSLRAEAARQNALGKIRRLEKGVYGSLDTQTPIVEFSDGRRLGTIGNHETKKQAVKAAPKEQQHSLRGDWGKLYPEILHETAVESLFGDRDNSVKACFLIAQARVLTAKGRPELARADTFFYHIPDFGKQFEAERTKVLNELLEKPEPPAPVEVQVPVPMDMAKLPDEELWGEIGKRMNHLRELLADVSMKMSRPPTISITTNGAGGGNGRPPEAPRLATPVREVRIAVVGLMDSQHQAIETDPRIQARVRAGMLAVQYTSRDKARLNLRSSTDGAVILVSKASHKEFDSMRAQVGSENVMYANGMSAIKEAVIDLCEKFKGSQR